MTKDTPRDWTQDEINEVDHATDTTTIEYCPFKECDEMFDDYVDCVGCAFDMDNKKHRWVAMLSVLLVIAFFVAAIVAVMFLV